MASSATSFAGAERGRRADFWTALVLLVLAAAMIGGALQFPLQGTYAGVQNVWYVSPALFPLIVGASLAVLAFALLVTAVRAGAARVAFASGTGAGGQLDVLLITGLIAAFVVCLVPRVDFIIAATLFLLAFTAAFHVDERRIAKLALSSFFGVSAIVAGMALLGWTPAPRSTAAYLLDAALLMVLIGTAAVLWTLARGDPANRPKMRQAIGVALLTPLLLGVIFKVFLLVPLPREGLVTGWIETIQYALRGLG